MNKPVQSRNAGFAAALVLLAIVVLFAMGTSLLKLGQNSRIGAVRGASEVAARCAADSGLAKAVFEMNEKLKYELWNDSKLPQATDQPMPGCDATFSYTVQWDAVNGYVIESTGRSSRAVKKVACTLSLSGPFEHAILTQEALVLKGGSVVDWYNYEAGDESLKIGTNSTASGAINLSPGAIVNGDIVVGAGGNPDEVVNASGATVTGQIYAAPQSYDFSPATVPDWLESMPSGGTVDSEKPIISSGKYDGISLGKGEIVTIDGPVTLYITGDTSLSNSAQLQINETNPDASLILYLGGALYCKNGGFINNITRDAKKLKIYGLDSCTNLSIATDGELYGGIYVPQADMNLKNSVNIFGAVVAKNLYQGAAANFNYDASLRDMAVSDEGVRFVVNKWREQ